MEGQDPPEDCQSNQIPRILRGVEEPRRQVEVSHAEVAVDALPETSMNSTLSAATPGRALQPQNVIDSQLTTPLRELLRTTVEADNQQQEDGSRPRRPSVGPTSSGDEDRQGRVRKTRIQTSEKRSLMLAAANLVHTHYKNRGKGSFIKKVVDSWAIENRKISQDSFDKFLYREMKQRDGEIENDDTSGREIRHGEYFEHLDIVRDTIKRVDQEAAEARGKRKKNTTARQAAKLRAKESLALSYSEKLPVEISDSLSEGSEGENSQETPEVTTQSEYEGPATRSGSRTPSTLRSARKKQKKEKQLAAEALGESIKYLAEENRSGAAELASALRGSLGERSTDQGSDLKRFVEESYRETAERLEALERLAEEREKAAEERQKAAEERQKASEDRILALLSRLVGGEGSTQK